MKKNFAIIRKKEDINELRKYKDKESLFVIFLCDIDFNSEKINPIHLPRTDVILLGRGKTISNLLVASDGVDTGLFSKVKSLYVKSLNFDNANVIGTDIVGTIVGNVTSDVKIMDSNISSNLKGNAYIGGLVGTCKALCVENTNIVINAEGVDFIGGLSSISSYVQLENVNKNVSIKAKGRTISEITPYVEKDQELIINYMLKPLLKEKTPIDY